MPKHSAPSKHAESNSKSGSDPKVKEEHSSKRPKRGSSSTTKKANTEKENIEADWLRLEKAQKEVALLQARMKKKQSQAASELLDEEDAESKEEPNPPPRSTSIQVLVPISAPKANKPTAAKFRRSGDAAPKPTPHLKANALKAIPPSATRESSPLVADAAPSDDVFFGGTPATETPLTSRSAGATQSYASSSTVSSTPTGNTSSSNTAVASNPATTTTTATAKPSDKESLPNNDSTTKVPALRHNVKHDPKNPKASDFEETITALILRACLEYESLISTKDAFPDSAMRLKWAKKCWKNAGIDAGESYQMSDAIGLLLRERGSRIRSRGITIVHQRLETIFGFEHKRDLRTIAKNKKLYEKLKNDSAFHWKDPDTKTGFAQGRIIYECLQMIWFEKKDFHGVVFGKYFKPIPIATIALIFIMVDFALDGWSTGVLQVAKMFEKEVASRYRVFLSHIKQWQDLKASTMANILKKFYKCACRDAGAAEEVSVKSALDDDTLKRMREELEGRTGETDSEAEDEVAEAEEGAERPGDE